MKKKIELPLIEPIYSTYQSQGAGAAILFHNPTIRNWYLNEVLILACNRAFLKGHTTPCIRIMKSDWNDNPYLETQMYSMEFLKGYVHYVIRNLLDAGYYVCFSGIDDYYMKGKSWYKERHFYHDGVICGYDQENKTYCIYAYDERWIYQKFWMPQRCFDNGRKSMLRDGRCGFICGLKPKAEQVQFSAEVARKKIEEYLDSTMEQYPEDEDNPVYGIVVHDYIAKYLGRLYDGSIPYARMDRRVFRMIWEHKKAMLERIRRMETELSMSSAISTAYESIVKEADHMRMLYASHHMKRRDSVLPTIQRRLLAMKEQEYGLLKKLLQTQEGGEPK